MSNGIKIKNGQIRSHVPSHFLFDVEKIRKDFPILKRKIYGRPLVYLDNAATTQKPQVVIDALKRYYSDENANVHRGVHFLSEQATNAYEQARNKIKQFINACEDREIIFVRGATEGINLVAQSYGRKFIHKDDEIVISTMEHHSNIVPWQLLCEATGAKLRVIPINEQGELILTEYEQILNEKTKLVAIAHVSNALGTINPLQRIIQMAHQRNIPVLVDGAQAVAHLKVDVQELDCDFYVFSGHKLYGPTGMGVVYGKNRLLEDMPPFQGGGDMISSVTFEKTIFDKIPYKFEAGTPNIAGVIGAGSAIDYISQIGMTNISTYENELLSYATKTISKIPKLRIIGTAKEKAGVISFIIDGIHPHDVGTVLNLKGIAIRAGHHCAMPVMQRFNVPATCRISFAFYNTKEEIDILTQALYSAIEVFS